MIVSLCCMIGIDDVLLQLGRTRMVIAILSTRRIVNDFKKDFFMIVLGFEDEIG